MPNCLILGRSRRLREMMIGCANMNSNGLGIVDYMKSMTKCAGIMRLL